MLRAPHLALRALLLLVALLVASPADAASFDPRFQWRTLDTEHFSIHFHQGEAGLAVEMAHIAEEVHELLSRYLDWQPVGRTQIVLVDPTDSSNGYASTSPYNRVVIYAVQPTSDSSLDNYENWLWAIFVHEYTHILQIDMIGGIPRAVRMVLGRLIVPNAVMPRWLTEGYATYLETRFTTGGRGRSTYTDQLMRLAALDNTMPRIDVADGYGQTWPRGETRYLFGARFHFEVERRTSDRAWVDFHQRHSRGIIPLLLPAKKPFGFTLSRMWTEWRERSSAEYLEQAEAIASEGRGLTPTRVLPTRKGGAYAPVFAPDGEWIWYLHTSPQERTTLRRVRRDGTGDERVRAGAVSAPAWAPDGTAVYWSGVGTTTRYESFRDLYRFDPEEKKAKRLSRGARLRDPAPHPEGDWLVAVQTWRGQTQLVRIDLPKPEGDEDDGSAPAEGGGPANGITSGAEDEELGLGRGGGASVTLLTDAADGSQYSGPAWDPSGERLAVSVWKPGGFRDIHVFDRDLRLLRTLTWDRASDTDPTWTPDGEHLVFASDRDGIWNLYAYRWHDGALLRITRLLGGAKRPSVSRDGAHIVFQGASSGGWRLEEVLVDPGRWEPVVVPARALPDPSGGPSAQALAPLTPLEGVPGPDLAFAEGPKETIARARARAGYETPAPAAQPREATGREPGPVEELEVPPELGELKAYNPLRTLFPPRYISVYGNLTDTGALGGLSTGGNDALNRHIWSARLTYQTDSGMIGGGASYTLNAFHPVFFASYSAFSVDYGRLYLRNLGPKPPGGTGFAGAYLGAQRYFERRDRVSTGVSIPIKRYHRLSASYKFELRGPLKDLPDNVDPRLLPSRGSFSGVTLGWTWGKFTRYVASISPENSDLLSASLAVESSYLGAWREAADGTRSELHRAIISGEGRKYITMPWAKNHVLAMRIAGGATLGTNLPQPTFRIGGAFGDNAYTSLPDRYYALRGYGTSSMRGDHAWVGTLEYRLPLFYIERGFWTAPLWLRSVSLTVFAEAGQVFDTADYAGYGGSPDGFLAFWGNTRPSVGAELVGDLVLAWGGLLQGRIGYGFGFGNGALPTGGVYAQLGTSF